MRRKAEFRHKGPEFRHKAEFRQKESEFSHKVEFRHKESEFRHKEPGTQQPGYINTVTPDTDFHSSRCRAEGIINLP